MIVDDLHVITMSCPPYETDSPLVVYPYRVLPLPVPSQGLQSVPGRRCQDLQFRRRMQLQQFAQHDPLERPKAPRMLIMKELLGLPRRKALNHIPNVLRLTLYGNGKIRRTCPQSFQVRPMRLTSKKKRGPTSPPPLNRTAAIPYLWPECVIRAMMSRRLSGTCVPKKASRSAALILPSVALIAVAHLSMPSAFG